jgi:hypothetical protein
MTRLFLLICIICISLMLGEQELRAQGRDDSLVDGMVIGAAVGAGAGVVFTHAVRDSDLTASQYARGALIFGAIGAGAGLGIDALLNISPGPGPQRVTIAPALWRGLRGVFIKWKW